MDPAAKRSQSAAPCSAAPTAPADVDMAPPPHEAPAAQQGDGCSPKMWSPQVDNQLGQEETAHEPQGQHVDLGRDLGQQGGVPPPSPARVVDLQPHESPSPLPASAMLWQKQPAAEQAPAQQSSGAGPGRPAAAAAAAPPAAGAGSHDSPAANQVTLPHLNPAAATPRMFGASLLLVLSRQRVLLCMHACNLPLCQSLCDPVSVKR